MEKISVAILGATGTVGQKFITLLENHPWFEVTELVASERSAGKIYKDACNWKQEKFIPDSIAKKVVLSVKSELQSLIVFSGLDASVAGEIETYYAERGHYVITNSKNHRMDKNVPILLPEVNLEHLGLLDKQRSKGKIISNSNCSTMFLAMVLGALHKKYPLKRVIVTTMQAISGSGYPGVPSLDILGNVVPFIAGEEEKIESELRKMLGTFNGEVIEDSEIAISAHCNRVPVVDGHLESVSVEFVNSVSVDEVDTYLRNFNAEKEIQSLPSAPEKSIYVLNEEDRPQPRLDANKENGMSVFVGRIRQCNVFDVRMTILGHNTIRGAAGAAILNAELLYKKRELFSERGKLR